MYTVTNYYTCDKAHTFYYFVLPQVFGQDKVLTLEYAQSYRDTWNGK